MAALLTQRRFDDSRSCSSKRDWRDACSTARIKQLGGETKRLYSTRLDLLMAEDDEKRNNGSSASVSRTDRWTLQLYIDSYNVSSFTRLVKLVFNAQHISERFYYIVAQCFGRMAIVHT